MRQIAWENLYEELPPIADGFLLFGDEEDEQEGDDHEENSFDNEDKLVIPTVPQLPVTISPFGTHPLNDPLNPRRMMHFCLGHTNFGLTESDVKLISETEGVDILLFGRYRFIVGIAKMFNPQTVKLNIQTRLCGMKVATDSIDELPPDLRAEIENMIRDVEHNPAWALYMFPNGRIHVITSGNSNDTDFVAKLSLLQAAKKESGGKLFVCKSLQ